MTATTTTTSTTTTTIVCSTFSNLGYLERWSILYRSFVRPLHIAAAAAFPPSRAISHDGEFSFINFCPPWKIKKEREIGNKTSLLFCSFLFPFNFVWDENWKDGAPLGKLKLGSSRKVISTYCGHLTDYFNWLFWAKSWSTYTRWRLNHQGDAFLPIVVI